MTLTSTEKVYAFLKHKIFSMFPKEEAPYWYTDAKAELEAISNPTYDDALEILNDIAAKAKGKL